MLDCYRPARAVHDMVVWAQNGRETPAERRYNPAFSKADLFRLGYIAEHSGHSTGAALDLTLVDLTADNSRRVRSRQGLCRLHRAGEAPARRKAASTWAPAMIVPTSRRTPRAKSITPAQRRWREYAGCRDGEARFCELFEGVVAFFAAGRGRAGV